MILNLPHQPLQEDIAYLCLFCCSLLWFKKVKKKKGMHGQKNAQVILQLGFFFFFLPNTTVKLNK